MFDKDSVLAALPGLHKTGRAITQLNLQHTVPAHQMHARLWLTLQTRNCQDS